MRILIKGVMTDGTKIQLEDWSIDFPSLHAENDVLASYPISKRSITRKVYEGIYGFPCVWEYPRRYHPFRLAFQFTCAGDAEAAFDKLLKGTANLLDYKEYMKEEKYADCL